MIRERLPEQSQNMGLPARGPNSDLDAGLPPRREINPISKSAILFNHDRENYGFSRLPNFIENKPTNKKRGHGKSRDRYDDQTLFVQVAKNGAVADKDIVEEVDLIPKYAKELGITRIEDASPSLLRDVLVVNAHHGTATDQARATNTIARVLKRLSIALRSKRATDARKEE